MSNDEFYEETCQDAASHGSPFRYCARCGWIEPPCGAVLPGGEVSFELTCTLHQDHTGDHQALIRWEKR